MSPLDVYELIGLGMALGFLGGFIIALVIAETWGRD